MSWRVLPCKRVKGPDTGLAGDSVSSSLDPELEVSDNCLSCSTWHRLFSLSGSNALLWRDVTCRCVEESKAITCQCRTISLLRLVGADYDQGAAAQDAAWTSFKNTYVGLVDADRLGNRTKTCNCHSNAFNGSDRWLNSPNNFFGTTSGCWKVDDGCAISSESASLDSQWSCTIKDTAQDQRVAAGLGYLPAVATTAV
jgi:hypothetical protein